MAERLARMDVGDVQLDHPHIRALDGVVQRHRGVGIGAGVEHHAGQRALRLRRAGGVDGVDQHALVVGLAEVQRVAVPLAGGGAQALDVGQRGRAVHGRLALAEQIQIGTVQHHHGLAWLPHRRRS
jgi:hypothetical protein